MLDIGLILEWAWILLSRGGGWSLGNAVFQIDHFSTYTTGKTQLSQAILLASVHSVSAKGHGRTFGPKHTENTSLLIRLLLRSRQLALAQIAVLRPKYVQEAWAWIGGQHTLA
eukprot:s1164_g6.t1